MTGLLSVSWRGYFFHDFRLLLAGADLRPDQTLHSYFKGRALRIYPALWINIAVLIVMLWIGGSLISTSFHYGSGLGQRSLSRSVQTISRAYLLARYLPRVGIFLPFRQAFLDASRRVEFRSPGADNIRQVSTTARTNRRRTSFLAGGSLVCFARIDRIAHPVFIGIYLWIFLLGAAIQVYWRSVRRFFEGKAAVWIVVYVVATYFSRLLIGENFNFTVPAVHNVILTVLLAGVVISSAFTLPRLASICEGTTFPTVYISGICRSSGRCLASVLSGQRQRQSPSPLH